MEHYGRLESMADESRVEKEDDRGPGAQNQVFVLMEDLVDKLQMLDYEQQILEKHNLKPISRHYFVASPHTASNPSEQFYTFGVIAAWLLSLCNRPLDVPQEQDDPNATVSNVLLHFQALGGQVNLPPSKLMSGSGYHVCYVLNYLAEQALKSTGFIWKRHPLQPAIKTDHQELASRSLNLVSEELEEDSVHEDADFEITLSKVEEMIEDEEEEEEMIDLEESAQSTSIQKDAGGLRPTRVSEPGTASAEWNLELERVLPQLKVTIRSDIKDWRSHLRQMHQHQDAIKLSLKDAKGYLDKLMEEINKTEKKVSSREKYINIQLEHVIREYQNAQSKLSEIKEQYQQGIANVTEKSQALVEVNENLEKTKQEMEEKSSSMSNGAPLVKLRQSLTKLKQEIQHMEVRVGVVEHTLLQATMKEQNKMTREMHATLITENGTHTFA